MLTTAFKFKRSEEDRRIVNIWPFVLIDNNYITNQCILYKFNLLYICLHVMTIALVSLLVTITLHVYEHALVYDQFLKFKVMKLLWNGPNLHILNVMHYFFNKCYYGINHLFLLICMRLNTNNLQKSLSMDAWLETVTGII